MADEAYRQHPDARSGGSFKDKIAARREERASGAASDEQREIAALQGEIGKLWELLNNLKGEGGIRVELPVIAFTARTEPASDDSGDMPPGALGDILYHDGSDWVVLPKPTASGKSFLSNDDTGALAWVEETSDCP